jgi:tetratricopeptide (TPR) repeat protein
MRALAALLSTLIVCPAAAAAPAPAAPDYRESGHNHFFNLEYDQAIADYTKLVEQHPDDPMAYNHLASAQLYKELYRLGMLESSALRGDNEFLRQNKPRADPQVKAAFVQSLERGRQAAESVLARNRRDVLAFYALGDNFALRGNYEFMVEKSWFAALRSGGKAKDYCEQVRKIDPDFVDAYLVLGVHEYVAGSLPLPVKVLAAIGGLHGSKQKAEAYVTRVARDGRYARDDARVLLVILYRREHRPLDAARLLEQLMADFPRNYVLGLELASMYSDAGQPERALAVFKDLLQKADQKAPGYERLPRAVARKIEKLQSQLGDQGRPGS